MASIQVPAGESLIIDAGVEVIFMGHYDFSILGSLDANGVEGDSVLFTADDTGTGWNGMRISTSTPSYLDYCIFEHSHNTFYKGGGALYCHTAIVDIRNCHFRDNSSTYQDAHYGGAVLLDECGTGVMLYHCTFLNNAVYGGYGAHAGGLACGQSSPRIYNCAFIGNSAESSSGGIGIMDYSSPEIRNCLVKNNSSSGTSGCGGIGIGYNYCNPVITNCEVTGNHADGLCGGIGISSNCNPIIDSCDITYNTTSESAGGIGWGDYSDPLVSNCIIRGNEAAENGGGVGIGASSGTIMNCVIDSNYAALDGGGITVAGFSNPVIHHCQVTANSASQRGGGLRIIESYAELSNNTISYNDAPNGGGIAFINTSSDPDIMNTILWHNTAATGGQVYLESTGDDPSFTYCNIEGGSEGFGGTGTATYTGTYENNIDCEPKFTDPEAGDYHLTWMSFPVDDDTKCACIDHGGPPAICQDPDGTICDIGAYYFDQTPETPVANEATNIHTGGFTAGWNTCYGALDYRLDVAYDEGFTNYVGEYEDFLVEGTQHDVTGVEQSTCYYRVRAANAAVTSVNSNTVMVLLVGIDDESTGIDPVRIIAQREGIMVEVLDKAYRDSELMIYNLLGQPVVSWKLAGASQYIPVETRGQVLIVKIQKANISYTKKLMLE
jgi:hypothetical protein